MSPIPPQPLLQLAAHLAAAGRYEAALAAIESLPDGPSHVEALLLKAKILAQQGDPRGAIDQWNQVLRIEPEHAEALAGRRRAQKVAQRPLGAFYRYSAAFHAAVIASVAAVVLLACTALFGVPPFGADGSTRTAPTAMRDPAQMKDLRQLEDRIRSAVEESIGQLAERTDDRLRTDRERLEQNVGDLQGLLRQHAATIGQEIGDLRENIQRDSTASSQERASRLRELARFSEQVSTLEGRLADYGDRMEAGLRELQRSADRRHRNELVEIAADVSRREPLTDQNLAQTIHTADQLLGLAFDEESQLYARRLIEWVEKEQSRREKWEQENRAVRQPLPRAVPPRRPYRENRILGWQ